MIAALVALAAVAALALAAAALIYGLYLGERRQRIALERQATFGTTVVAPAREVTTPKQSEEVVRDIGKPFTEQTVTKGMDVLRRQYREIGRVVNDAELRAEVEAMLYGGALTGPEGEPLL